LLLLLSLLVTPPVLFPVAAAEDCADTRVVVDVEDESDDASVVDAVKDPSLFVVEPLVVAVVGRDASDVT
jgi:hypothetical protein